MRLDGPLAALSSVTIAAAIAASAAGHQRWIANPDAVFAESLRTMFDLMVPRRPTD
ncbi:acyl-CoA-like ligand-binding transcription factor [Gordonia sp. NPDC003424]